ncbi:MAG: helix-hairpin-helix domain-containing protein [bacterium]
MRLTIDWERVKGEGGELVRRYGVLTVIGVVGVVLVGIGVYSAIRPEKPVVEIVKSEVLGESEEDSVVVDVAGAVEKPGMYKLASGSRIGDALVMAGGLAAEADRGWVARYINLASRLEDGGKIYIPGQAESKENQGSGGKEEQKGLISINTASVGELDSLWGIGEARAKAIIENRPYATLEELMSKVGLPESVYTKIKDEISVY